MRRVYPRVRGGIWGKADANYFAEGLSPRARGNRVDGSLVASGNRSIPACAGESTPVGRARVLEQVYPRVRGGIHMTPADVATDRGLSPRARGNPPPPPPPPPPVRSIPACAGESDQTYSDDELHQVYPRVRGGICGAGICRRHRLGLSPRARGNPRSIRWSSPASGSIPACAGESASSGIRARALQVYPRVRGGIQFEALGIGFEAGLSPRARGNPRSAHCKISSPRSIPACAGESEDWARTWGVLEVYPRVRGGIMNLQYADGL